MTHKLKEQLIRLGSTNPELRSDIRPVLNALATTPARRVASGGPVNKEMYKAQKDINDYAEKRVGDAVQGLVSGLDQRGFENNLTTWHFEASFALKGEVGVELIFKERDGQLRSRDEVEDILKDLGVGMWRLQEAGQGTWRLSASY